MATSHLNLRKTRGLNFYKLIGTGSGQTFSPRSADLHHWGLVASWADEADARVFEFGKTVSSWDRCSFERARFLLRPVATRGTWAGADPFSPTTGRPPTGQVAAITRARIRPSFLRTFHRSVPPVAASIARAKGVTVRTGIGEAPIGLQGTFSVWDSNADLVAFARDTEHAHVVEQTNRLDWYSEELFARFDVLRAEGTFCGSPVDLPRIDQPLNAGYAP